MIDDNATGSLGRRTFLGAAVAGVGAVAFGTKLAFGSLRRSGAQQPNIVLICADDLGYGDLSGYGRPDYSTPQLDRLATQGTRFTQAYSIMPICTPTRVGMMTGRYPARHPIGLLEPLTLSEAHRTRGLDTSVPTLPMLLKEAGYTTALFGKWHLGRRPEFQPRAHGYDESFGPLSGAVDYVGHHNSTGEHDLYRNGEPVHVEGYLTDVLADEAARFIRQRREPFFLSHQGTAPHTPLQRRGDPPLAAEGNTPFLGGAPDRFPDLVRALDHAVGRMLAALEESGVADRTLVIFTSDNGGRAPSNNGGLARGKSHLWEGGIRVPAFARWPGVIPAGITTTQVASTLDWTATILAAAGASAAAESSLDGIDLLPVLSGRQPPVERTIYWRTVQRTKQGAVRHGHWKFLRDEEGEYLFDLSQDPGERDNARAWQDAEQDARFETMKAMYEAWNAEMLPPP